MNFLDLAANRYSVRSFRPERVSEDDLKRILRAGQLAPTACNLQPQRILVVNDEKGMEKFYRCTECHFHAPTSLIVCYDRNECWKRAYDGRMSGEIDAGIVCTHMMLEAASIGVGSTWVMYFIPDAVREEFAIPDSIVPVALLVLGYSDDQAKPAPMHAKRKPIEETVFYGSF